MLLMSTNTTANSSSTFIPPQHAICYDGEDEVPKQTVTTVYIDEGTKVIPDGAFQDCELLEEVLMPTSSLTSIGSLSFSRCYALREIEIPEGVTSVPNFAFANCKSLETVKLPSTLKSIGFSAFAGCFSLRELTIPETVTSIDEYAFENCHQLRSAPLPKALTFLGEGAFSGCLSLRSVIVPPRITTIGKDTFRTCSSLKELTFEVSKDVCIGEHAVYNCPSLDTLVLQPTFKFVDETNFERCPKLRLNRAALDKQDDKIYQDLKEKHVEAYKALKKLNHRATSKPKKKKKKFFLPPIPQQQNGKKTYAKDDSELISTSHTKRQIITIDLDLSYRFRKKLPMVPQVRKRLPYGSLEPIEE